MFFVSCFLQPNSFEIVKTAMQSRYYHVYLDHTIHSNPIRSHILAKQKGGAIIESRLPTQPTFATGKALRALPKVCPKRHRPRSDHVWKLFVWTVGRKGISQGLSESFSFCEAANVEELWPRWQTWTVCCHGCFNLSFSVILKFVSLKHQKYIFVRLSEKLRRCCWRSANKTADVPEPDVSPSMCLGWNGWDRATPMIFKRWSSSDAKFSRCKSNSFKISKPFKRTFRLQVPINFHKICILSFDPSSNTPFSITYLFPPQKRSPKVKLTTITCLQRQAGCIFGQLWDVTLLHIFIGIQNLGHPSNTGMLCQKCTFTCKISNPGIVFVFLFVQWILPTFVVGCKMSMKLEMYTGQLKGVDVFNDIKSCRHKSWLLFHCHVWDVLHYHQISYCAPVIFWKFYLLFCGQCFCAI